MASKNGTVATPAWAPADYRLHVDIQQLELDDMAALMKASQMLEGFSDLSSADQFISFVAEIKQLVAPFVERIDGRPVTPDEALWRAGRLRLGELTELFQGLGSAAVPPSNAGS